jgi:hypothetical protein
MINHNNILNQEKVMEKTVEDLEQYYRYPSNEYLMLCELIDNSISSYISNRTKLDVRGLNIEILIDSRNKENRSLTVTDNANGMDAEVLENAIYFGNPKNLKKSSGLNIYGVGLKQAAFFSGKRLEINSKIKELEKPLMTYIDLNELEKREDKKVIFSITQANDDFIFNDEKIKSGTKIIISKLRTGRFSFNSKSKKDTFIKSLG